MAGHSLPFYFLKNALTIHDICLSVQIYSYTINHYVNMHFNYIKFVDYLGRIGIIVILKLLTYKLGTSHLFKSYLMTE